MLLYRYFYFFNLSPLTLLFFYKMHPVGFEPTHLSIAELKSAPLDHSGTNAFYYYYFIIYPNLFFRPTYLLFIYTYIYTYIHITHYIYIYILLSYFLLYSLKILWRWGVSIPLPLACEANALPSELHPLYFYLFLFLFPLFPFLLPIFFFAKMHPVGFEPTHLSIAVLETAPLDHSGTNASLYYCYIHCPVPSPFSFFK